MTFANPHFHFPELHRLDLTLFESADFCNFVMNKFNSTCEVQGNGNMKISHVLKLGSGAENTFPFNRLEHRYHRLSFMLEQLQAKLDYPL